MASNWAFLGGCYLVAACGGGKSGGSAAGGSSQSGDATNSVGAGASSGGSATGGASAGGEFNGGTTALGGAETGGSSAGGAGGDGLGMDGGNANAGATDRAGAGGKVTSGGAASGGVSVGGTSASGGNDAGSAGTGGDPSSCDDIACPDLGTCALTHGADGCVRTCSFSDLYEFRTADDVARLAALRCDIVEGGLYESGRLVSLAGLETIREVRGDIYVYDPYGLSDLSGFAGLETVTGIFLLNYHSGGTARLATIRLSNLKSLGGLVISGNGSGDTVHSIDLPSLETVGDITIAANPTLTSIRVEALQTVTGNLGISANSVLPHLDGFASLVSVSRAGISYNPKLPQCEVDAFVSRIGASCGSCSANDENATCN